MKVPFVSYVFDFSLKCLLQKCCYLSLTRDFATALFHRTAFSSTFVHKGSRETTWSSAPWRPFPSPKPWEICSPSAPTTTMSRMTDRVRHPHAMSRKQWRWARRLRGGRQLKFLSSSQLAHRPLPCVLETASVVLSKDTVHTGYSAIGYSAKSDIVPNRI